MTEIIAFFAPALITVGFYNHLHQGNLSIRRLIFSYGIFVVFINILLYMMSFYILGIAELSFGDRVFIFYTLAATALAFVLPFVVRLIETTISIDVTSNHNAKK